MRGHSLPALALGATLGTMGPGLAQAPSPAPPLTPDQVIERASSSVAIVLAAKSGSDPTAIGSAVVVRDGGVLLTVYHLVKDAQAVQVRFSSGETFDEVQLLGVDRRRDVAAIRITATALPVLPVASAGATRAGDPVCVVSHAAGLPWSASTGIVSAFRLADEIPGAGTGYRLLQFSASVSPGSSGGVVLDDRARALGLIVGSLSGGQNLNFAVPLESVLGLADAPVAQTFRSGASLQPPTGAPGGRPSVTPVAPAVSAAPPAPAIAPQPVPTRPEPGPEDLRRSEALRSKDKDFILRNFRTMCVDAGQAAFFGNEQLKAALVKNPEFSAMGIVLVDDKSLADTVLTVGFTLLWDYPFSLQHQNTSITLLAGKGSGPFSGPAGATSVAKELAKLLRPYRTVAPRN